MGTGDRGRFRQPLAALAVLGVFAYSAIALADNTQTNDTVTGGDATKAAGSTGSASVRVVGNNAPNGDASGCNLDGADGTITLSSDQPWLTFPSGASVTMTDCGNPGAKTIAYAVGALAPAGGVATVTTTTTGGITGSLYNEDSFTVTVSGVLPPTDTTKPVITATATKADSSPYVADTWTNQDVTVSFACADEPGGSGLATNTVGGGGTLSSDTSTGSFTNTGTCTDNAGNTADSVTFSPIKIDKSKPVITASAKNADNSTYTADTWTNQDVTVSFSCSDGSGGSGIANDTVAGDTVSNETSTGSVTNTGVCTDNAGNSADSVTFSPIKIDKTAPAYNCTPSAADGNWHGANVSFSCTANDESGGSGLADSANDASFTLSTTVADDTVDSNASTGSNSIADNAGNSVTAGPITGNMIDRQDPVVTCDTPAPTFTLNQSPANVTGTASDGSGSGLASSTTSAAANTSAIGGGSVSLSATDNVGNTGSTSCSYSVIYNWTGFFRPVDNLPILNTVKAGSSVPVKFSLGGNQGLNIFAATTASPAGKYPISQVISCSNTALADGIEETVNAGGSSLTYDAVANQYIYVWKTEKGWAGTCRQLVVKLVDNTYHWANFKLTK